MCTRESHAAMKLEPGYREVCAFVGIQVDPEGEDLEMRDCPHCHSTLYTVLPASMEIIPVATDRGVVLIGRRAA